jgi:hypothetical protein
MWPEEDMSYVRRALPALWWKERGLAAHKADMLNKDDMIRESRSSWSRGMLR